MDITDLTPLERRIWRAFPHGTAVDVRPCEGEDPAAFRSADRDVRAEVVRALLLAGSSEPGEAPALRVAGARIIGVLDLQHVEIHHPVRLTSCHIQDSLKLDGAQTRQLDLSGSHLSALAATSLRVDGALRLTGCQISGNVRLSNAEISSGIFLEGARLGSGRGWAFQLDHASVGADVRAPRLVALGGLHLGTARVEGAVDLEDARKSLSSSSEVSAYFCSSPPHPDVRIAPQRER